MANVLIDSGFVSRAAILGHDGRAWAASPGFHVQPVAVQQIVDGFVDPCKIRIEGMNVGTRKYTCTKVDSSVMIGRDSATGYGCIVYRCKTCILVGVYEETHPGGCYNMLVKVGDYLRDQGY